MLRRVQGVPLAQAPITATVRRATLAAVQLLHQERVVHTDLQSRNIYVETLPQVRLISF